MDTDNPTTIHIRPPPPADPPLWKSCCVFVDPGAVRFFTTLGLSVAILFFCFLTLTTAPECGPMSGPLWGLIGTVVGVWFPNPSFARPR